MSCRQTQKQLILKHLRQFGSLTTLIAAKRYNICRLSQRIKELDNEGYLIRRPRVNRNGKSYTAYSLVEGKARAA